MTVIGAISPPGGDFTEPVTAHTERFVRCLWTLDRDLAYARHYPAVSWAASFSRDSAAGNTDDPVRAARRARITGLLAEGDRLADLVELVGITALPPRERVAVLAGRLLREGLLQQNALSTNDATATLPRRPHWRTRLWRSSTDAAPWWTQACRSRQSRNATSGR